MQQRLSIRPGNVDDIPVLQDLQVRAGSLFREAGMHSVADNPPDEASTFRASIVAGLLHVAARADKCVGFTLALGNGTDCHLEQMSVDPDFGRQGIGSALLRHLISLARTRRYTRVTLSTFNNVVWNAPFYERFEFVHLPEADLTPALVAVREVEVAIGLDMSVRTIMVLPL
jgi:ribosomal protein S18 acetylase RimI-like enzyme